LKPHKRQNRARTRQRSERRQSPHQPSAGGGQSKPSTDDAAPGRGAPAKQQQRSPPLQREAGRSGKAKPLGGQAASPEEDYRQGPSRREKGARPAQAHRGTHKPIGPPRAGRRRTMHRQHWTTSTAVSRYDRTTPDLRSPAGRPPSKPPRREPRGTRSPPPPSPASRGICPATASGSDKEMEKGEDGRRRRLVRVRPPVARRRRPEELRSLFQGYKLSLGGCCGELFP
jgi:hypothetical protein